MQSAVDAGLKQQVSDIEALCEVQRELEVRHRIFDNWVRDGKMSWVDARDRYARLRHACAILKRVVEEPQQTEQPFSPKVVNA